MKGEEREEKGGSEKWREGKYEEGGKKLLEEIPSADLKSLILDPAFPPRVLGFSTVLHSCFVGVLIVHIYLVVCCT